MSGRDIRGVMVVGWMVVDGLWWMAKEEDLIWEIRHLLNNLILT